jgi:hypothetical protein
MQVNARCVHFALFLLQFVWSSRTNFERIEVTPRITATRNKVEGRTAPRGKTLKLRFLSVRLWSQVTGDCISLSGTCCRIGGPQIQIAKLTGGYKEKLTLLSKRIVDTWNIQ